jgi:hypothetical protein
MTDSERHLLVEKCGQILHDLLVQIRNLSGQEGNAQWINDLADLAHNIPLFMTGRDDTVERWLRGALIDYARKYHPDIDPASHRYARVLDMTEDEFSENHRRYHWNWLTHSDGLR